MIGPFAPPTTIIPVKPRVHRRRRTALTAPPAPLALVAAHYDGDAPGVYLTFDRAVEAGAVVLPAIVVDDARESIRFIGSSGPSVISPVHILVFLTSIVTSSGPEVLLNVGAGNGIMAVDDGGCGRG